jgi:hypothetical protein
MNQEYPLIKEIVLLDPPSKWTLKYKKQKFDSKGKLVTKQEFYLTGNLFYSDRTSFHLTSKIIQESKEYLYPYFERLPELEKLRLEFEYHSTKHIDLDNKANFWIKLVLDILKTPTQQQIVRALKHKKPIITTRTINDDNTKCVDEIKLKFVKGEHKMIFRIYGVVKSEQKELDLFFK